MSPTKGIQKNKYDLGVFEQRKADKENCLKKKLNNKSQMFNSWTLVSAFPVWAYCVAGQEFKNTEGCTIYTAW